MARQVVASQRLALRAGLASLGLVLSVLAMQWLAVEPVAGQADPAVPANWEQAVHLSVAAPLGAYGPTIRADGAGRLIVVYTRPITEAGSIISQPVVRASTDLGESWSAPTVVYTGTESASQATMAVDGNNLTHVVWRTATSIYHAREDQWPAAANEVERASEFVFSPAIAIEDDNTVHVAWTRGGGLYHAFSIDGGATWSPPEQLASSEHLDAPSLAIDHNGRLHVVWQHRLGTTLPFQYEIRHKRGNRTGADMYWESDPTILSVGVPNVRLPTIQAAGDQLVVAFARREPAAGQGYEHTIYATTYSPDAGWSLPSDITGGSPVSINDPLHVPQPALQVCAGRIHAYFDGTLTQNGKERIIGVSRPRQGQAWSGRSYISSEEEQAIRPALACAADRLHMVYEVIFELNVDHQIYYVAGGERSVYLPILRQ